MSFILSGPKRTFVMLLFWERLAGSCATCPFSLTRTSQVLGADDTGTDRTGRRPSCRVVLACRVSRVFRRRLVGLSFHVLEPGESRIVTN
jgi:hypothetical protein